MIVIGLLPILIPILFIATVASLIVRPHSYTKMKLTLIVLYIALIAQWLEESYAVGYLDDHPDVDSHTVGWFGQWYALVFLVTLIAAITLHISLLVMWRRGKKKKTLDASTGH